ncbi:DUF4097 family beta strand repeat-containing protein [Angustibacter peucedani]
MTVQDVAPTAPAPTPQGGNARPLLRGLGIALAVASVLAGTLSLVGSLARDSLQRSATYQGVRVVDVDVSAEHVELVAGPEGSTQLTRRISWSLARPTVTEQLDGDRLVVRSHCPWSFGRGCSGRVELVVPPGTEVHAHSSAGSVSATGLTGVLDLSSSAGGVDGEDLAAATVRAQSSAGSVELAFATAPTSVDATSSAGSVEVALPRGAESYLVDAGSSAGSTEIGVRTDPTSAHRVRARSSAGSVHVVYAN